jgi:hypothetical protein
MKLDSIEVIYGIEAIFLAGYGGMILVTHLMGIVPFQMLPPAIISFLLSGNILLTLENRQKLKKRELNG